jgi:hypothetical protein
LFRIAAHDVHEISFSLFPSIVRAETLQRGDRLEPTAVYCPNLPISPQGCTDEFWSELDNTRTPSRIRPGKARQRSGSPITLNPKMVFHDRSWHSTGGRVKKKKKKKKLFLGFGNLN